MEVIDFSDPDLLSVFESDGWQMMQQGRGDLRTKPSDGAIVTRRQAAQYKQQRAAKGTKGKGTIVTPTPGSSNRSAAQKKAGRMAKTALSKAEKKAAAIREAGRKFNAGLMMKAQDAAQRYQQGRDYGKRVRAAQQTKPRSQMTRAERKEAHEIKKMFNAVGAAPKISRGRARRMPQDDLGGLLDI